MKQVTIGVLLCVIFSAPAFAEDCTRAIDAVVTSEEIDELIEALRCMNRQQRADKSDHSEQLGKKEAEIKSLKRKLTLFKKCEVCIHDKYFDHVRCAPMNQYTGYTNENRTTTSGTPKRIKLSCPTEIFE